MYVEVDTPWALTRNVSNYSWGGCDIGVAKSYVAPMGKRNHRIIELLCVDLLYHTSHHCAIPDRRSQWPLRDQYLRPINRYGCGWPNLYTSEKHTSLKILECRIHKRRNYYSKSYRNGLFPTDVLSGDLQPHQAGVSRPCRFRASSPDVAEVGDLREIASDVAEVGAFSGWGACGRSLQT